jgi:hypothetical protein
VALLVIQPTLPSADATPPEPEEEQLVPLVQRDVFSPYPPGKGALTRDDLPPTERAKVDALHAYMTSPHHGKAVHRAWSRGSVARIRYHELKMAQRAAGLEGVVELGVK